MTAAQTNIIEMMKTDTLKKYGRVCYVGNVSVNANSVKPLIKDGLIKLDKEVDEWEFYVLTTNSTSAEQGAIEIQHMKDRLFECQRDLNAHIEELKLQLKQKDDQLTHLAGQLHTKEVEYEMMKETVSELRLSCLNYLSDREQRDKEIEQLKDANEAHAKLAIERGRQIAMSYSIEQIEQEAKNHGVTRFTHPWFANFIINLKQQKEGK